MKEFYFIIGKEKFGPFSKEQLIDKGLTNETLIWTDGIDNWQKLMDNTELVSFLKPKQTPPPIPIESDGRPSEIKLSGEMNIINKKSLSPVLEAIKPSKKILALFIAWCGFHLFALLMSYSEIKFFNNTHSYYVEPSSSEFWPFVKFFHPYYYSFGRIGGHTFMGIFFQYDWTEFAFYVSGAIIVYLVLRIAKN